MNVYVAGVLGLLGVLAVIAGAHGKGTQLFTALTGMPLGSTVHLAKPGGPAAAPAASVPAPPSLPAGGSGPVISA